MNNVITVTNFNTISSNFSWDEGIPNTEYLSNASNQTQCVGYAPYSAIEITCTRTPRFSSVFSRRTVDFGDYYNSKHNKVVIGSQGDAVVSHNYIMPGTYTITLKEEEWFITLNPRRFFDSGIFETSSDTSKQQEKPILRYTWQEYRCPITGKSPLQRMGYPTTWRDLKFQAPLQFPKKTQLDWMDTQFCFRGELPGEVYWQWDNLVCAENAESLHSKPIKWDEAKCGAIYNKLWVDVGKNCTINEFILSSTQQITEKKAIVKVSEVPPTAYLSALQTQEALQRRSPLTVRLTPRFTKAGSFPIERIVWDMGDGSPLITRRRWEKDITKPFVYTGALSGDYKDPRNFDIIYTYRKNKQEVFSFYPSITAYASSTDSSDVAATTVGPMFGEDGNSSELKLIQTENRGNNSIILGEIEETVAIWKTNN